MIDHWAEFGAPVHIQLANFFGSAKPRRRRGREDARDGGDDIGQDFGGGFF